MARWSVGPASAAPTGCLAPQSELSGRIAGPGGGSEVCYDLDLPAGAVVARSDDRSLDVDRPVAVVVDSQGVEQCSLWMAQDIDDPLCELGGTAPYRVVVTPTAWRYDFTLVRVDAGGDCPALDEASFGVTDAALLTFDPGAYTRCATVAGDDLGTFRLTFRTTVDGRQVRPAVLGDRAVTCAPNASELESWDCPAPVSGPARLPVVLTIDAERPTDVQLNWRSVAHATGCETISAALGQPAYSGTLDSALEIDCLRVAGAEPEDVTVGLLQSPSPEAALAGYAGGEGACSAWDGDCQVTGATDATYLISATVWATPPLTWSMSATGLFSATGANPDCAQVPTQQFGFGPVDVELGPDHPVECFVLTDSPRAEYTVTATPSTGATPAEVRAFDGSNTSYDTCDRSRSGPSYACNHLMSFSADRTVSGVLLVSRPPGVETMTYRVGATCTSSCVPFALEPTLVFDDLRATVRVDETLTAPRVIWSADPTTVARQWLRDGLEIAGATDDTYRVRPGDLAHEISVRTTPARALTAPVPSTSSAAEVRTGAAPEATSLPRIEGRPRVGRVLTTTAGSWSRRPTTFGFRWYVDGKRVGSAPTLTLRPAWVDRKVTVTVLAHRSGCATGRATSRARTVRG